MPVIFIAESIQIEEDLTNLIPVEFGSNWPSSF
jgi:hypothetical protein